MPDGATGASLNRSVLVLNRHYLAVHVMTVRRALSLVYRDLAEVIHVEEGVFANHDFESWLRLSAGRALEKHPLDDWIQAVNFELQAPRVIRLLGFERAPRLTARLNRRNLLARDDHRCQYCGGAFPPQLLSLDHVLPRSRGGATSWENVVCSCTSCNGRKGNRTPQEARMKLLKHPRKPRVSPALTLKLDNPRYACWRTFVAHAAGES